MNDTEARHFRNVTPFIELVDIRPSELSAVLIGQPPTGDEPAELSMRWALRLERKTDEEFVVVARFEAVGQRDDEQKAEFVRFVYASAAHYQLTRSGISDEELEPFAKYNSMLHQWPYFRTFVQSACGQMMLPPILLPVLRIPRPHGQGADDAQSIVAENEPR